MIILLSTSMCVHCTYSNKYFAYSRNVYFSQRCRHFILISGKVGTSNPQMLFNEQHTSTRTRTNGRTISEARTRTKVRTTTRTRPAISLAYFRLVTKLIPVSRVKCAGHHQITSLTSHGRVCTKLGQICQKLDESGTFVDYFSASQNVLETNL